MSNSWDNSASVTIDLGKLLPIFGAIILLILLVVGGIKMATMLRSGDEDVAPVAVEKEAVATNEPFVRRPWTATRPSRPSRPRAVVEPPVTKPSITAPVKKRLQPAPLDTATGAVRLALSMDGKLLATLDVDNAVALWDLATGERLRTMSRGTTLTAPTTPTTPRTSPKESYQKPPGPLLPPGQEPSVKDTPSTRRPPTEKRSGVADIRRLAFSPDGRLLALKRDKLIEVWDTSSGARRHRRELDIEQFNTAYVGFTSDSTCVVTAFDDHVALLNVATGIVHNHDYGHFVLFMACSPIANRAVLSKLITRENAPGDDGDDTGDGADVGGEANEIGLDVMDLDTGKIETTILRPSGKVPESPGNMAFGPDGQQMAVCTFGGPIVLLETEYWRIRSVLQRPDDEGFFVYSKMAVSPLVVEGFVAGIPVFRTASGGEPLEVWSVRPPYLRTLSTNIGRAQDVAFTSNGQLAVIDAEGRVRLLDPSESLK